MWWSFFRRLWHNRLLTHTVVSEFTQHRAKVKVIAGVLSRRRFPAANGVVTRLVMVTCPMDITRPMMIIIIRPLWIRLEPVMRWN